MIKLKIAQNECANWDCGNCLGCDIHVNRKYLKNNNWVPVFQTINSNKVNKPCIVEKERCAYFEEFVDILDE
tara:strand:- start:1616 stop:1831 length:216 start_codon:yes stop_codon:yes gene_type:complete